MPIWNIHQQKTSRQLQNMPVKATCFFFFFDIIQKLVQLHPDQHYCYISINGDTQSNCSFFLLKITFKVVLQLSAADVTLCSLLNCSIIAYYTVNILLWKKKKVTKARLLMIHCVEMHCQDSLSPVASPSSMLITPCSAYSQLSHKTWITLILCYCLFFFNSMLLTGKSVNLRDLSYTF